jgi:hypothetical protein
LHVLADLAWSHGSWISPVALATNPQSARIVWFLIRL